MGQGYYMNDFEAYKKGLQEQYGITDVEEAIWIKPKRNSASKPLILSFRSELPAYLDIPGETIRTKVYEYKKFPTHCSNCLEYGHPKRICRDDKRCANCTSTSHSDDTCGNEPKCLQCNGNHRSGYKKCREYQFECEVLALQSKSRISKSQARLIFERENPNFRTMNYSQAVASNTQNSETPLQQPTAPTNQPPKPPNETTQQHAINDSPRLQKLSTNTPKSNSSKKSQENQFPKPPTNIQNNQIEKTLTNTTYTDVLHEDELTARNNPEKYYETKKIYDEYDPSNQDRDKYEEEPKKSVKPPTNIQNNQIEKTLTNTTDTDVLHEDDLTSRINPEKYYEAKKIFDEYLRIYPENRYEAKKILNEYVRISPENRYEVKKIFEEEEKNEAIYPSN